MRFIFLIHFFLPLLSEPTETEKMDTDSDSQPDKVRYGPTTSSHLYLLLCHVYGLIRIRSEVIYNIPALLGFLAMRLSILSLVLPSSLSIQSSVPSRHLHFSCLMLSDSRLAIPHLICCRRSQRMKRRSPASPRKSRQRPRRKRMRLQGNPSLRKRKRVREENPRQQVQTLLQVQRHRYRAATNDQGRSWNLTHAGWNLLNAC